jgi:hypothetical protein
LEEGEHLFEIQVVGEIGRDTSTGEIKYACACFPSTKELVEAYTGKTINATLMRYERHGATLRQVGKFIATAKRNKVSD